MAGLSRTCVTDSSQLCRGVPDVAALSGDIVSNGYGIWSCGPPPVVNGLLGEQAGCSEGNGGGTSLSSPLWTGMWARLTSTAPAGSPGYGFANEAIYEVAKDPKLYAQSFFDITAGANGLDQTQPGYDYVTGFGVPKLAGLIAAVQQVAPAAPAPPPAAAPASSQPPAGAPSPASRPASASHPKTRRRATPYK